MRRHPAAELVDRAQVDLTELLHALDQTRARLTHVGDQVAGFRAEADAATYVPEGDPT